MEENNNTHIDAFLKKHVQEIPLESPSSGFTKNLMEQITVETSNVTKYVPLISKKGWSIIGLIIVIFSTIAIFIPFQKEEASLLDKIPEIPIDFSFLTNISFSGLYEALSISNTTLYIMLLFSILFFVQAFYLKGYFNKKVQ